MSEASKAITISPDELEPATLRGVAEAFINREGTDYGEQERSLDDKVSQVLQQLERGEAHIVFDPETESINLVTSRELEQTAEQDPRERELSWEDQEAP